MCEGGVAKEFQQQRVLTSVDPQGMGFAKAKALDALEACGGDMQSAIEWLVSNCV